MERGGWCQSPAPRSRASRPRIQRLLEEPKRSGRGPGPDCTGALNRGPGTLPARPPHSQTGRQPSGSPPPLGAIRSGEPPESGTCACSREVSPWSPGRFLRTGWGCKLQTSATRVVEKWGPRGAGKLEAGGGGCSGEQGVHRLPRRGLLSRLGLPQRCCVPAARGLRVPVPPGSLRAAIGASGLQPRWGPGAGAWRRGPTSERLGGSPAETPRLARRWRL